MTIFSLFALDAAPTTRMSPDSLGQKLIIIGWLTLAMVVANTSSDQGQGMCRQPPTSGGEVGREVAVVRDPTGHSQGDTPSERGSEAHDSPVEMANFAKLHADIEAWHAEASATITSAAQTSRKQRRCQQQSGHS